MYIRPPSGPGPARRGFYPSSLIQFFPFFRSFLLFTSVHFSPLALGDRLRNGGPSARALCGSSSLGLGRHFRPRSTYPGYNAIFETESLGRKGRAVGLSSTNEKCGKTIRTGTRWSHRGRRQRTHGRMTSKRSEHSNVSRYENY